MILGNNGQIYILRDPRTNAVRYVGKTVYEAVSPAGITHQVSNLRLFCREHGLNPGAMSSMSSGNRSQHKGWRIKKVAANVV